MIFLNKRIMDIFKYCTVVLILLSCKTVKNDLELTILNKEFVAYCPKEDCMDKDFLREQTIKTLINSDSLYFPANIIKYKVENKSNKCVFFMPMFSYSGNFIKTYYLPSASLGSFLGMSYSNLVFNNLNEKQIKHISNSSYSSSSSYYKSRDSLTLDFYNKMGYNNNNNNKLNGSFQTNSITIPAKTTIYFESYFTMPYNQSSNEYIELDKKGKYTINLSFISNKDEAIKHLSNSQKETIKHNNYKIFDGELISTNSVPIIFKD